MKSHYPISTLRRCGGLIGWGRGELGRPAGVRTTLLVCPAAVPWNNSWETNPCGPLSGRSLESALVLYDRSGDHHRLNNICAHPSSSAHSNFSSFGALSRIGLWSPHGGYLCGGKPAPGKESGDDHRGRVAAYPHARKQLKGFVAKVCNSRKKYQS